MDIVDPRVKTLDEAIAHLRNVAGSPGYLVRTGSAAEMALARLATLGDVTRAQHAELLRLRSVVARLEGEHRPYRKRHGRIVRCLKCTLPYPCPTRSALDGEQ